MVREFGRNNKMVKKLVESMVKANLAVDPAEASRKLDHWSTVIRKDYETKNNLVPSATDATLLDIVQHQSVLLNKAVLSQENLATQVEKLTGELAGVREDINSQSTSIITALSSSLVGAVQGVFGRNNNTATERDRAMVERAERVADRPATTGTDTPLSSQVHPLLSPPAQVVLSPTQPATEVVTALIENMQGMLQDAEKEGGKDKLVELSWTPLQSSSIKGMTVKDTLLQLAEEKRLVAMKKLYDVEPSSLDSKNRGHYWSCMELVESVIADEQQLVLQMNQKDKDKIDDFDDILKITAYSIEKAAFDKMKDLDGKNASTARPTISGLGNRYTEYCKRNGIDRIKTSNKHPSAAPAGTKSITDWFSRAAEKVVTALSPGRPKHG